MTDGLGMLFPVGTGVVTGTVVFDNFSAVPGGGVGGTGVEIPKSKFLEPLRGTSLRSVSPRLGSPFGDPPSPAARAGRARNYNSTRRTALKKLRLPVSPRLGSPFGDPPSPAEP
ncbi:MAG: hypothetical protein FWD58_04705 [Firmicutes bacterium]|nr:hypothetical protein [Bacillota bacterium]